MKSATDSDHNFEVSLYSLKLMKSLSVRTLPLSINRDAIQSRISHPLVQGVGLLLLAASVFTHFYALGAKSEADRIVYDESATWIHLGKGLLADATATEVLFSRASRGFAKSVPTQGTGTILSVTSSLEMAANPVRTLPMLAGADNLEATLLALNYGY